MHTPDSNPATRAAATQVPSSDVCRTRCLHGSGRIVLLTREPASCQAISSSLNGQAQQALGASEPAVACIQEDAIATTFPSPVSILSSIQGHSGSALSAGRVLTRTKTLKGIVGDVQTAFPHLGVAEWD